MRGARGRVRIAVMATCAVVAGALAVTFLTAPPAVSRAATAPALVPPPLAFAVPRRTPHESSQAAAASDFQPAAGEPSATSGVWTPLTNQPATFSPSGVYLLTDGRVLAQGDYFRNQGWWTLTPDNTGSYINGTWSQVASPPACPNRSEEHTSELQS